MARNRLHCSQSLMLEHLDRRQITLLEKISLEKTALYDGNFFMRGRKVFSRKKPLHSGLKFFFDCF